MGTLRLAHFNQQPWCGDLRGTRSLESSLPNACFTHPCVFCS